eukprot:gene24002-32408_t
MSNILRSAVTEAFRNGIMGAIAGWVQVFALMWLRTASNYQYRFGVSFTTALKELYRQGGVLRFYNGIFYALLQSPLSKFGSIAANEGSRVLVSHYLPNSSFSDSFSSALGAFMSMLWRIFLMPVETCKTVLQVDGSLSVALATFLGHYPWFFTHNILDRIIPVNKTDGVLQNVVRSAVIGFCASAVSDIIVNPIRIIKTVKQSMAANKGTANAPLSYSQVIQKVLSESGWQGLLCRGLSSRIIGNGIQSIFFTVIWKSLVYYDCFKSTKS